MPIDVIEKVVELRGVVRRTTPTDSHPAETPVTAMIDGDKIGYDIASWLLIHAETREVRLTLKVVHPP